MICEQDPVFNEVMDNEHVPQDNIERVEGFIDESH